MTNNTITNVPRELLADLLGNDRDKRIMAERHLLAMLANAPSPDGVDGLVAVKVWEADADWDDHELVVRLSDAKAIIDGLRGEVAAQEETANQWRELALQFDRHRMTAMAHIRAAASGDKSAIEALGVFAALPPIPGHEITAERDQQAQRIGELEGLLRSCLPALSDGGCAALAVRIDAALSAVCAAAPNIAPTSEHSSQPERAKVAELVELVRSKFPRIDPCQPVPLDEKAHCCEYTIYVERERLNRLIDAKLASLR